MIQELKFQPNFPRIVERFVAWWVGELIDRPPVSFWLGPNRVYSGPVSNHATLRDRWFDAEFQVNAAIAGMEQQDFVGDSLPVFWPNMGPEVTGTLYGCEMEFGEDTSWSIPTVHNIEDWDRILKLAPNFQNPYWQNVERLTDLAIQKCQGRYLVGLTDLHGTSDILAALRDPQELCTDLIDAPETVLRVGRHVRQGYLESFRRSYQKLAAAGFGSTTWCPMYHPGPAYVPSADFWCMLSPAMARQMILPDLLEEMAPLERSIFHLDGPTALPHLDMVLYELPRLNALQWVFGAGRGPARRWLDVYRRARAAGKSIQVVADDLADALAVLDALGPRGMWITVASAVPSAAAGEAFLKEVERRTAKWAKAGKA